MQQTHNLPKASSILATPTAFNYMEQPDPYIQFLENWIPGISESTELHDQLHDHFGLGYRINDEARILGFQLGHHATVNSANLLARSFVVTACRSI